MTIIIIVTISLLVISMLSIVLTLLVELYSIPRIKEKSYTLVNVVETIRADLKRLLAAVMANASQTYAFHPYMHNLTMFRLRTYTLINNWTEFVSRRYGIRVQVGFPKASTNFQGETFHIPPKNFIFKLYWYKPTSVSLGCLNATISIPRLGIRDARIKVEVGLFMSIINVTSRGDEIDVYIKLMVDEGIPVADIRGVDLRVLFPDLSYYWRRADIISYKYLGGGVWCITISNSTVMPIYRMGITPKDPDGIIPLRIYAIDWRGIVVSGITYSSIVLRVERNTPDKLYYFNPMTWSYVELNRGSTPDEVYVIELDWNFSLHFLLNEVPLNVSSPNGRPPPIPPIPVKQMRVCISSDLFSWRLCPFQSEYWRKILWHDHEVWIPVSPANPVYWFNESCRLVFRVPFYSTSEKYKYINITWESDCDADIVKWPTSLQFDYNLPEYKDIVSETFRVELIDIEHSTMRDYGFDYHGVAALGFRDPNGTAYGPTNIHAFGKYRGRLGRYRPYGKWEVFSRYIGSYSWLSLPVRILAVLDTESVGNVYAEGDVRTDYYATLAIVYIINGSKYMACLQHIYWKNTQSGSGVWMFASMGGGRPERYMYLVGEGNGICNMSLGDSYLGWGWYHREYDYPNFFCTHWGSGIGRAIFLSRSAVSTLRDIGSNPVFAVTKWASGWIPQHSLEYQFSPLSEPVTFTAGTYYSYWFVVYRYSASDADDEWLKAYKYSPMFLEDYAPSISLIEVGGS